MSDEVDKVNEARLKANEKAPDTRTGWTTIATISAEDTAAWLASGEDRAPWTKGLIDPEKRRQLDEGKLAIQRVVSDAIARKLDPNGREFLDALEAVLSEPTKSRYAALRAGVGGPRASYLLGVMIHELVDLAWSDA